CIPASMSPTGGATTKQDDKPMISDGKTVLGTEGSKKVGAWIEALPPGSGIFLIAIIALVFLFLFVRK
ncbi:MAG: hypothetical protein ACRD5H_10250, partial [Nitrososphaerales archaeon]